MKIPGKQHQLAPIWGREVRVQQGRLPVRRGKWKVLAAFSRGIHPACGMPAAIQDWLRCSGILVC